MVFNTSYNGQEFVTLNTAPSISFPYGLTILDRKFRSLIWLPDSILHSLVICGVVDFLIIYRGFFGSTHFSPVCSFSFSARGGSGRSDSRCGKSSASLPVSIHGAPRQYVLVTLCPQCHPRLSSPYPFNLGYAF